MDWFFSSRTKDETALQASQTTKLQSGPLVTVEHTNGRVSCANISGVTLHVAFHYTNTDGWYGDLSSSLTTLASSASRGLPAVANLRDKTNSHHSRVYGRPGDEYGGSRDSQSSYELNRQRDLREIRINVNSLKPTEVWDVIRSGGSVAFLCRREPIAKDASGKVVTYANPGEVTKNAIATIDAEKAEAFTSKDPLGAKVLGRHF